MKKRRCAKIVRKTGETSIALSLNLDGTGKSKIHTPIGFLNHMLALFSRHGNFDLSLNAKGDTCVDIHHTNEDIGICLGLAFKEALKKKISITRFGFSSVPMDESLVEVSLDLSSRPYLKFTTGALRLPPAKSEYNLNDLKHFLIGLVNSSGMTMHVELLYAEDLHHVIEAAFKALARALREACTIDNRFKGIPSTKGKL